MLYPTGSRILTATTWQNFWRKVRPGLPGECWEWIGAVDPKGYGMFTINGHPIRAHRVAFIWAHGPIAPGLLVRHLCHTKPCVNPTHLASGTYLENYEDRFR